MFIALDYKTTLTGGTVPTLGSIQCWAVARPWTWVLDQYKEKKPKDPTIAAKFTTYKFANYKEHVVDLLHAGMHGERAHDVRLWTAWQGVIGDRPSRPWVPAFAGMTGGIVVPTWRRPMRHTCVR